MSAVRSIEPCACEICTGSFVPRRLGQKACGFVCEAERKRQRDRKREARRALKQGRERLRTLRDWIRLARSECHKFIRLRDVADDCISCHMPPNYQGQWHASHYMPAGNNSALMFDEANIHKGCAQCNTYKSGNRGPYRVKLIVKVGLAEVERLEGPQPLKRWTIPELRAIRDEYRQKAKALQQ